jgi:hypothetical protein
LVRSGTFGFALHTSQHFAKPKEPLVRWQKNKKMRVGQKLNLCVLGRVSPNMLRCFGLCPPSVYMLPCPLPLLITSGALAKWRKIEAESFDLAVNVANAFLSVAKLQKKPMQKALAAYEDGTFNLPRTPPFRQCYVGRRAFLFPAFSSIVVFTQHLAVVSRSFSA